MKGGGFFVLLFLLFCFLWGVFSVFNGIRKAAAPKHSSRKRSATLPVSSDVAASTPSQKHISELQTLFSLHQSGALTRAEFEHLKQDLLKSLIHTENETEKE